jgi:general secretion pathway protein E
MTTLRSMASESMRTIDARPLVDDILRQAVARRASDVHFEPTADGLEVRYRVDGLLETVARHDATTGRSLVTRLMVMAQLLTYRLDIPQEGRASAQVAGVERALELRISVMPTTHGMRAAVRLPAELISPHKLDELRLPVSVMEALRRFAETDSGMLVLTGPAGSGKTTTIYGLLRYMIEQAPGLSIVALEDPVERDIAGVTQIEVTNFGELTYERALRSILRQDPQVLMLGEIRDAATASLAIQAALSGHRLISTLHASTPAGAIARLLEMGVEPYQLTSALYGVVAQRLVRISSGVGRIPVAEFVGVEAALRAAILRRADADELMRVYAQQASYRSMRSHAKELVEQQMTNEAEVQRALGGI